MRSLEPHELLLRHFSGWCETKQRVADVDLVGELLGLRDRYDELEPTYWPAGSVEHLLLERWPSKGDVGTPEEATLVDSLDAWFRFLRSTGRMAARSAEPKELTREARRAAPRMGEVASDRSHWSSTKVIMEFGREHGLIVDGIADIEELQAGLNQTMELWNSLPVAERRRLMPDPSGRGHRRDDLPGRVAAMEEAGTDDPLLALVATFTDRMPTGEVPPPEVAGPQFRDAPYLRQVLALADWIGDGKEMTATEVLRLAPAHEAYDTLGLHAWTVAQLERRYPDESLPGVAAVGRSAWIDTEADRPWRSAADCEALDRLWWGASSAGLVAFEGRRVVQRPFEPEDDEAWLVLGIRAVFGLLTRLESRGVLLEIVAQALLTSYVGSRSRVPKAELVDFYEEWVFEPELRWAGFSRDLGPSVDEALGWVCDTGLLTETEEHVQLTEAGDVFVTWWLKFLEAGL